MCNKPIVLYIIDGLQQGGAEKSLLSICGHLSEFQPYVIVRYGSLELAPDFEKSGVLVKNLDWGRTYNFWKIAKTLKSEIEKIKPSIIHSFLFYSDMSIRYIDTSIPRIGSLVSNSYSKRRLSQLPKITRFKIQLLKFWDLLSSSKLDLMIANSNSIRSSFGKHASIGLAKIKTIYRGRRIQDFQQSNIEVFKKSRIVFVSVGRLIPSKGFKELILAFKSVSGIINNIQLCIAGEGPLKDELQLLIDRNNLSDSVVLCGKVTNIPHFLINADFFVFPSHYEGLPGALIEAMLAKLPIICSDIPENRECVDEEMALFHQVMNAQDLARQMESALKLPDWPQRTEKAYAYACTHFDVEKIAGEYEKTYLELIGKGDGVNSD